MLYRLAPLIAFLLCASAFASFAAAKTVNTKFGSIEGVSERGIAAFKGIPYAAAPVGDRRWREPQPPAAWQGVRRAGKYAAACIQAPYSPSDVSMGDPGPLNEDCLYLNVWTPRADPAAKLPVMVWIHGGAFVIGTGGLDITDGGPLASKGAVIVAMNYRLGPLGFFAHPALEKENPGGPANFGLLDQIAALKWVRDNIEQFGGDPGNVTIFGESAGGKSVLALFASPLARGLFHKGVAQSSYVIPDMTRPNALEMGAKVSAALGLKGDGATMAQLRGVPAKKFGALRGRGLSSAPVPIAGDAVLPRSIETIFEAGEEAPLPLIAGNNSDDSSVAVAFGVNPADVVKKLRPAGLVVRGLYPGVRDAGQRARQVTRDLIFTMPVRWIADRHSKLAPTWRYYFDYSAVKLRPKYPNGAPHGGEILFVMNTGDIYAATRRIFTDADRKFSETISDYWFTFARDGAPSAPGGPAWPDDRGRTDRTMVFDDRIRVEDNFMKPRLDFMINMSKLAGVFFSRR